MAARSSTGPLPDAGDGGSPELQQPPMQGAHRLEEVQPLVVRVLDGLNTDFANLAAGPPSDQER